MCVSSDSRLTFILCRAHFLLLAGVAVEPYCVTLFRAVPHTGRDTGTEELDQSVMAERRNSTRYPLRLPVVFSPAEGGGQNYVGGFTRDVSTTGVYVVVSEENDSPPLYSTISLRVMLPPLERHAHGLQLETEGYVIRVNDQLEQIGFAASADLARYDDDDYSWLGSWHG